METIVETQVQYPELHPKVCGRCNATLVASSYHKVWPVKRFIIGDMATLPRKPSECDLSNESFFAHPNICSGMSLVKIAVKPHRGQVSGKFSHSERKVPSGQTIRYLKRAIHNTDRTNRELIYGDLQICFLHDSKGIHSLICFRVPALLDARHPTDSPSHFEHTLSKENQSYLAHVRC